MASEKKAYDLKGIGANFRIIGDFITGCPYGSGHINDTFAVSYNQGGFYVRYIFQRINHRIFTNPPALMENVERVTSHQRKKLSASGASASRRALEVVRTRGDQVYHQDAEGNFWRVYVFIERSRTYDVIENSRQAFQAAKAFGEFQNLLADLPGQRLHETIPDFHHTVKRFGALERAIEADAKNRAQLVKQEIEFAMARKKDAAKLLDLGAAGKIPERITHNDTKLNNVMIDDETGKGICVIDLDTVMPGFSLYDFGDLVRTSTTRSAEDERDLAKLVFQESMYKALIDGYLEGAAGALTTTEIELLPFGGKLMTFEVGIRFLADFLAGDVYFKIHREGHNLDRCRTQFELVRQIEQKFGV